MAIRFSFILDRKKNIDMEEWESEYSNAQGYGLFCGKKCVAKKQAQGIPPKRGKKNIALWEAQQKVQQQQQVVAAAASGGKSKAPIIIATVLGIGLIIGAVVLVKRRNK